MAEIVCTECGTTNHGRVEFCSSCGAFLAWEGPVEEPPSPPPRGPPSPLRSTTVGRRDQDWSAADPPAARPRPPSRRTDTRPRRPRPVVATADPTEPRLGRTYRPAPSPPATDTGGFGYTIKGPPGRRSRSHRPAQTRSNRPARSPSRRPPGRVPTAARSTRPNCGSAENAGTSSSPRTPTGPNRPTTSTRPKRPWWQRWIPRSWLPDSELLGAEARRAFRRSLPTGLRVRRWGYVGGGLGLIIGLLFLTGSNPVQMGRRTGSPTSRARWSRSRT